MNDRFEMRFTGSGGQGVILASVIIAEAAILSGLNAIQSQSYGPEARGGTSKAEAIIGKDKIWFAKVVRPNFLLALTQEALEKFSKDVSEDALIIIDSHLSVPAGVKAENVISIPILETARYELGKAMTANIVAIGAINTALSLFPEEVLQEAVKLHIPKGTEELNMKALAAGEKLASAFDTERFKRHTA